MDDSLREQLARLRADHKQLAAQHQKLEEEHARGIGRVGSSTHRDFLEHLKAHLRALHEHHELIRRHHDALEALHESDRGESNPASSGSPTSG